MAERRGKKENHNKNYQAHKEWVAGTVARERTYVGRLLKRWPNSLGYTCQSCNQAMPLSSSLSSAARACSKAAPPKAFMFTIGCMFTTP